MNQNLNYLQAYPFEKLKELFKNKEPAKNRSSVLWSIGEPKHNTPIFLKELILNSLDKLSNYPLSSGTEALRNSIRDWLTKRFSLLPNSICSEKNILPVNGTREALFAFCQLIINQDDNKKPLVLMPNPFYQIYEGAAILAGAGIQYINLEKNSLKPDFSKIDKKTWEDCQLIYICTPGNPSGAVLSCQEMQYLIELADEYNFVIASDECYSEIYPENSLPPPGLLEAANKMGRHNYERCIVFHSLSKRSNVPGMRSGFVAGDKNLIEKFKLYRTYHGCAMSLPFQIASTACWQDENHVIENRHLYQKKFDAVVSILKSSLKLSQPAGSFYLFPETPYDDKVFAANLYEKMNLTVLPGSFLSRENEGYNPGENHIRIALVASLEECIDGAERLKEFLLNF